MPKYKLTENGNIVVQDGKPVVIGDDEKEFTIDAIGANDRITALNGEAAKHRREAKAAADKLAAFDGIEDPAAALEAIQTAATMDSKSKADMEALKESMNKTYQKKLSDKDDIIKGLNNDLFKSNVVQKFATSKKIEETILPLDIAVATFGNRFNPDGTANGPDGNVILSQTNPGEPAGFDEALGVIIESYPHRDSILKSKIVSGGGAGGAENGGAGGVALSSQEKIKAGLAERDA